MLYLLDFPNGEQVEEDFGTVREARRYAFNLLQRVAVTSDAYSARLARMTSKGPEFMGYVNLDGQWTRDVPPEGTDFFDLTESGFVSWKPIVHSSVVIFDENQLMFDSDLFTQDGVRNWLRMTGFTEAEGIGMSRVRMKPSFDGDGDSCWVFGDGDKSCLFWRVERPEGMEWNLC